MNSISVTTSQLNSSSTLLRIYRALVSCALNTALKEFFASLNSPGANRPNCIKAIPQLGSTGKN